MTPCKHPRVQIVAREEDSEFVECLECREIFESSEFKDMAIEETKLAKEEQSDPGAYKSNQACPFYSCRCRNTLLMSRGEYFVRK